MGGSVNVSGLNFILCCINCDCQNIVWHEKESTVTASLFKLLSWMSEEWKVCVSLRAKSDILTNNVSSIFCSCVSYLTLSRGGWWRWYCIVVGDWRVMFRAGYMRAGQAVCLNCPCWQRLNLWDQWKIEGEPFSIAKTPVKSCQLPQGML